METKTLITETSMGIRLPQELKERLQTNAEAEGKTLSDWVKEVLTDHLDDPTRRAFPKWEEGEQEALQRFLKRKGYSYLSTYLRSTLAKQLKSQATGGVFEDDDQEMLNLAAALQKFA